MLVTNSAADPAAQPLAKDPASSVAAQSSGGQASNAGVAPTDSVALSAAAQQVLTGQAVAPPDGPAGPDSEALKQATDLLNDTTGKASVADQLDAFALISGFVANGENLDRPTDPATALAAGAALYDSAFAKHQRRLLDDMNSVMLNRDHTATATTLQDALATFDGFSAQDREIYVGAINQQAQTASGAPAFASADSYRANLQAQIDVHSSVEAAGGAATGALATLANSPPQSDAWTQKAQAYFAQYGPAPPPDPKAQHYRAPAAAAPPTGAALMAALVEVNDSSGRTSVKDQLAAYDLLTTYSASGNDQGPARDAVLQSFQDSAFAKHVAQVNVLANGPVFASDVGAALLDRLNRLTPDDQQIAFHLQSSPGGAQPFASLDSLKDNDQTRSDVQNVVGKIFAKFGGDDLTKLTDPRLVNNPAFNELLDLVSQNPASDGWTAQAKKVLSDIASSLDLTPDDPHAKDAAAALARLKSPPPVDAGHAIAMKTLKKIGDDLQQARDAAAAVRAGHSHKGGKPAKAKSADKTDPSATAPPPAAPQAIYAPGETVDTYA